jgi:predicted nucleic acid-binding protein
MPPVFADTGYWIALIFANDDLHDRAIEVRRRYVKSPIISSEMVLTEFLNECGKRGTYYRNGAVALVEGLYASNAVQILPQTPALFAEALALYKNRPDKQWSLTDCASFTICQEYGITEAFAYDNHFAQAGIKPLMRQ